MSSKEAESRRVATGFPMLQIYSNYSIPDRFHVSKFISDSFIDSCCILFIGVFTVPLSIEIQVVGKCKNEQQRDWQCFFA